MSDVMQRILHGIRVAAVKIPGGVASVNCVLGKMSRRQNDRARKNLQSNGMIVHGVIFETLSRAGVAYFADHGTLLGLIRENGVIAHDTDMDFSIPPEESLERVSSALVKRGFRIVHGFAVDGVLAEMTLVYRDLSIDFFQCHFIGDHLGHYIFVNEYAPKTGTFVRTWARERKRPPLAGLETRVFGLEQQTKVSIPKNADEYLTASYGNWRVPDSTTDFSSEKIPTQYRNIYDGCRFLSAEEVEAYFTNSSLSNRQSQSGVKI